MFDKNFDTHFHVETFSIPETFRNMKKRQKNFLGAGGTPLWCIKIFEKHQNVLASNRYTILWPTLILVPVRLTTQTLRYATLILYCLNVQKVTTLRRFEELPRAHFFKNLIFMSLITESKLIVHSIDICINEDHEIVFLNSVLEANGKKCRTIIHRKPLTF